MRNLKYCLIYGTRPEIVKFAPIIYELQRRNLDFFAIHTNQHSSQEMSCSFIEQLALPTPEYYLQPSAGVFDVTQGIDQIVPILDSERPDVVLVQGDTNSTLAGALAANIAGIKLAHVEAGLRGGELFTKEEQNTIHISTIADVHFAPSMRAMLNLYHEGIRDNLFFVGNTIIDITKQKIEALLQTSGQQILDKYGLKSKQFILFTAHKAEVVDDPANLIKLIEILGKLEQFELPVLFPIHPRTKYQLQAHGLSLANFQYVSLLPSLCYEEFLILEKHALCLITDGGGVQEECCVLGTPVLILKDATQRGAVIDVGAATICSLNANKIIQEIRTLLEARCRRWFNPFGQGDSARRIIAILEDLIGQPARNGATNSISQAAPILIQLPQPVSQVRS